MKKFIFASLILTTFFSCSHNNLVDITSKTVQTSGFQDVALSITDTKETDSMYVYTALGLYKSDTVGMEISLKKGLKAGIVHNEMKNVFLSNAITLRSIGSKSDKLLTVMTELYAGESVPQTMRSDLMVLPCANFGQEDLNYTSGEYKFKAFMETAEENAELFMIFDFANKLILLNEKDVAYRKGVLNFLKKK